MLDESLLDTPEALAEADRRGLLRGAAEAGARVRTAARHAAEAGVNDLKPDGRPRAVLIAGPGAAAAGVADLLGTLAGASCPVTRLPPTGVAPAAGALRWELPGWAGSVDLLLIPTPDGTEPGLVPARRAGLPPRLHRRRRRPRRHPARRRPSPARTASLVPLATAPYDQDEPDRRRVRPRRPLGAAHPAARARSTASACSPPRRRPCDKVADRLDQRRRTLRPGHRDVQQPRQDPRRRTRRLAPADLDRGHRRPARPAAASPPRSPNSPAAPRSSPNSPRRSPPTAPCSPAPLAAGADPDDFFRDRVEEAARAARARGAAARPPDRRPHCRPRPPANSPSATTPPISELEPEAGGELETLAELIAITDFAAVYLALAATEPDLDAGRPDSPTAPPQPVRHLQEEQRHGPPRQHRPPLRLGFPHRHPAAARHRADRRTAGRDVDGRPPRRTLAHRPRRTLVEVIDAAPETRTRRRGRRQFGPRLPFLLKILAAGAPLSLQVHPDLAQAKEGYADEERRGIPVDAGAPQLQGRQPQARTDLRPHRLRRPVRLPRPGRPRTSSTASASTPSSRTSTSCTPTPRRPPCARSSRRSSPPTARRWPAPSPRRRPPATASAATYAPYADIAHHYPGDPGVIAAMLLNHVRLQPGEALFLGAGVPHAYLDGLGVEIMANSDNVLRCGLTPKHVDVPELLRIVRFEASDPGVLRPEASPDGEEVYDTPIDEFRLSRYVLPEARRRPRPHPPDPADPALHGRRRPGRRTRP